MLFFQRLLMGVMGYFGGLSGYSVCCEKDPLTFSGGFIVKLYINE